MKQINLPFEIGQEYEILEFDLDYLEEEKIQRFDSYLYVGEVKKFLDFSTDKTELIFYWDKLEIVILTFLNVEVSRFTEVSNALSEMFGNAEIITQEEKIIHKFKNRNIEYWCVFNFQTNTIIILYGIFWTIQQVYLSLLS